MDESFHDREHQFEAKFAHDQEILFKAWARRDHLFAAWVARQLGDKAPREYAKTFRIFAFGEKADVVIDKAQRDLREHGIGISDGAVRKNFETAFEEAREQVVNAPAADANTR